MRAIGSLRGRITVVATVLVAVTLSGASAWILRSVERDVRAAAEDVVEQVLVEQAARIRDVAGLDIVIGANTFELGVFEESEGLAFGELFVGDTPVAEVEVNLTTGRVNELLDPQTGETLDDPDLRAELETLTFVFLEVDGEDGPALLAGAIPQAELELSSTALRRALLTVIPVVVVVFAVLAWWLVGRALRPVDRLTERVDRISSANLDERLPVPAGGDEVARLAIVMNEMLDRLERSDERQRRFAADASHELRSPLTTIRAAAELIADHDRPGPADDIVAEVERMDSLIGDLLALARSDAGVVGTRTVLDLGDLAREVVAGSTVELRCAAAATVTGEPGPLGAVIRNLVDNARRHARSRVRVTIERTDGIVRLTVEDDGPGVAAVDRNIVFERFARLDEARARDAGGAGLGLAMVKSIVERNGGTVRVARSARLGGAVFVVELPGS